MTRITTEATLRVTKVIEVPDDKVGKVEELSQDEFVRRSFEDAIKKQHDLDKIQIADVKMFIHDSKGE